MTSRREFVIRVAGIGAALALPEVILADPYRPIAPRSTGRPIRVRGRVVVGQRGVRGARVSDGRTVVKVDDSGRFDFVTTDAQRYVSVCPPSGYALPTHPTGTIKLYTPIKP
ncbi:MAG: metallophosphoesterase N-terminal domain-containing protein, partial [Gemmatimonadaceae bacterium]